MSNVYRDRLDLSEIKSMLVSPEELQTKALKAGDILVIEGHGNPAELGRAAIWSGAIEPCVHQNHLIRVRTHSNFLRPGYLSRLINSSYGKRYFLTEGKTTSGLNTISTRIVKAFPVLLPPIELQDNFVAISLEYEQLQNSRLVQSIELRKFYEQIIDSAFSGHLLSGDGVLQTHIDVEEASYPSEQPKVKTWDRPIFSKLSETQRHIWESSQSFSDPFNVDELTEAIRRVKYGNAPNREHLVGVLDLLVALGVVIQEGRDDADLWRRPDPENDQEIEV